MRAQKSLRVAPALKDQPRWLRKFIQGPNFYSELIMPTLAEADWDMNLFPLAEITDIIPGSVLVRQVRAMPLGLVKPDGSVRFSMPFNHFCVVLSSPSEMPKTSGYPGQTWRVVDMAYWQIVHDKSRASKMVLSWIDLYDLGLPEFKPTNFSTKSKCRLLIPSPKA